MTSFLKPLAIALSSIILCTSAYAVNTDDPFARDDGYSSFTGEYKDVNGVLMNRCFLNEESTVNFCKKKSTDLIKSLVDTPANFSKNSVLLRFWDKSSNGYIYAAYHKPDKKFFYYPYTIRVNLAPFSDIKLSFGQNNNMLCTTGVDTVLEGDIYTKSYSDDDDLTDLCSTYSEIAGFSDIKSVDAKTRKLTKIDDYKL